MKKNNIPVLILSSNNDIIAFDYINGKIIFLDTKIKLEKNNVYLINFESIYSKEGIFRYRKIKLVKDKTIGLYQIDSFIIKMQKLYYDPTSKFQEVINYHNSKYSFHLVRFSGTKLKKSKGKYTLKMGSKFVNIVSPKENWENFIENEYSGYALVQKIFLENKKFDIYNAISLFGSFFENDSKENDDVDSREKDMDLLTESEVEKYINNEYVIANSEKEKNIPEHDRRSDNWDYGIYQEELDYEPNTDDEIGYQANMLFNDFITSSYEEENYEEEYYNETLYEGDVLISEEKYDELKEESSIVEIEEYKEFEKEYREEENRKINFLKKYELIDYDTNNIYKIFENLKNLSIIQEKMKKSSFYEIIGKVLVFINFCDIKEKNSFYKFEKIDDVEFSINYERYNSLLALSEKFLDDSFCQKVFSYEFDKNRDFTLIGKNGISDDDLKYGGFYMVDSDSSILSDDLDIPF